MGHVAVLCYDLQSLNRLCITHDVVEENWPVFLNPIVAMSVEPMLEGRRIRAYHGNS
jgi:hypothetical protein